MKTADIKARINYHAKRATVLCPNGHFLTSIDLNENFGGSRAAAELSARSNNRSNVYDRMAQDCAIQDATERNGATLSEQQT
jgi:hypothetical protein